MTVNVTCTWCGWVHYAVTRAHAEAAVKAFSDWFDQQPADIQAMYGNRKPTVEAEYNTCFNCRVTSPALRLSQPNDCPRGCTLQPIIYEEDHDDSP